MKERKTVTRAEALKYIVLISVAFPVVIILGMIISIAKALKEILVGIYNGLAAYYRAYRNCIRVIYHGELTFEKLTD